jgi:hypothetical protein
MHSTIEGRIGHNFTNFFLCVTTLKCQFTEVNSPKQLKAPVQEISLVMLAFFHLQAHPYSIYRFVHYLLRRRYRISVSIKHKYTGL